MDELTELRQSKQPLEYPSCGSVFKRPVGHYTGQLIQQAGLQGLKWGGAQVSENMLDSSSISIMRQRQIILN